MNLWMDVMRDLEHLLDNYERLFDAWEDGGVTGLVVGSMNFNAAKLVPGNRTVAGVTDRTPIPTFDPNPEVYHRLGVEVPATPQERLTEKRAQVDDMFAAAKERGWTIWIFRPYSGEGRGGNGHQLTDEVSRMARCARMIDTLEHYPMVDGGIMDGPEWGYEIAPHHLDRRSYIFDDLPKSVASKCAELGYDYLALVATKDRLYQCLHSLSPSRLGLHASGGLLGAFQLLGGDPDLMTWLEFRVEAVTDYVRNVRECLTAETNRPVKLGLGMRSAAFAPLCGSDFAQIAEFMDILLPKHYFWNRGFDGMVGTVYRYVETLTDWNPGLSDADALAAVNALFGLELPHVTCRSDLEDAFSPEFFEEVVTRETRRALAAVDNPNRIVPWVDTGRSPHDGDPMSPGHLRQLLSAAESAGLKHFLYHHHNNLTAGEWAVISEMCGERWNPLKTDYRPPDELVM
jgi:hypothetical protein